MLNRLEKIKDIKDHLDKTMYFAAVLAEALEKKGITPVLVGGGALEFYTQGNYMTLDIDLVVEGREQAKKVLEEMGFHRISGKKNWYNEDLELSVEIPDYKLAGSMERVTAVDIEDNLTAYVIGIEDLLIDRLNAYKYWRSLSDGEWASATLSIHFDDVDFEYLKVRAEEDGIADALEETVAKARKLKKARVKEKKKRTLK